MGAASQSTFFKFPRGLAELEITVRPEYVGVAIWGPRSGNAHPQILLAGAAPTNCWRTASTYPGELLPEKLCISGAVIGLSRQEAELVDAALRALTPSVLRDREAA